MHTALEDRPWSEDVKRSVSRFGGRQPALPIRVEPLVLEVVADVIWAGKSFRHPLRYLRARPDVDPAAVTLPEHLAGAEPVASCRSDGREGSSVHRTHHHRP